MISGDYRIVLITEEYFKKYNTTFIEMLDTSDLGKQARRMYLFLSILIDGNNILVPLRTTLPDIKTYGLIGYPVPSEKKPHAGLDYRKMLIINDDRYLNPVSELNIPSSQKKIINENYKIIVTQIKQYVRGYIKAVKKNRHLLDKKFRFSTLHNFHEELCLIQENA